MARAQAVLLATALAVLLSGCADEASTASDGLSSATQTPVAVEQPTPLVSPSEDAEEAAVLAQYNAYWPALTKASEMPVGEIRDHLDDYATGRSLERNYGGLLALKRRNRGLYGEVITRPEVLSIKGDVATVQDCQDGSNDGQKDLRTGKKITKGLPRTLVKATLRQGPDLVWRVSTVTFPEGEC